MEGSVTASEPGKEVADNAANEQDASPLATDEMTSKSSTSSSSSSSSSTHPLKKTSKTVGTKQKFELKFKKRKKRNLRKKAPSDYTTDENEEKARRAALEEARELQLVRSRKFKAMTSAALTVQGDARILESNQETKNTSEEDSGKFLGAFSEEVQSNPVNIEKEKYIEEQLRLRRLGKEDATKETPKNTKKKTIEERIYEIPNVYQERPYIEATEESGDRWLTGITEVALPIETKLKNIEETEKAKQKLLQDSKLDQANTEVPRNFNSDFRSHHSEHIADMEQKRKRMLDFQRAKDEVEGANSRKRQRRQNDDPQQSDTRKRNNENVTADGSRLPFATDHELMQRFVRRYKYR